MLGYCTLSAAPISALCLVDADVGFVTPNPQRTCYVEAENRVGQSGYANREIDVVPARLCPVQVEVRWCDVQAENRLLYVEATPVQQPDLHGGTVKIPAEVRLCGVLYEIRLVDVEGETRHVVVAAENRRVEVDS